MIEWDGEYWSCEVVLWALTILASHCLCCIDVVYEVHIVCLSFPWVILIQWWNIEVILFSFSRDIFILDSSFIFFYVFCCIGTVFREPILCRNIPRIVPGNVFSPNVKLAYLLNIVRHHLVLIDLIYRLEETHMHW